MENKNIEENDENFQKLIGKNERLMKKLKQKELQLDDTTAKFIDITLQFTSCMKENTALSSELAAKRAECFKYKDLLEKTSEQVKSKEEDIGQLRHDLNLQAPYNRRNRDELNELSEQLALRDETISDLQNNLRAHEHHKTAMENRLAETEAKLKQSEKNLRRATETLTAENEQIKESSKNTEDELKTKNEYLLVKMEELNMRNNTLYQQQEDYRKLSSHLQLVEKTKTAEIDKLMEQVSKACATNDNLELEIRKLRNELDQEIALKMSLESDNKVLLDEAESKTKNLSEHASKVRELMENISERDRDSTELKRAHETAKRQYGKLRFDLTEKLALQDKTISDLRTELSAQESDKMQIEYKLREATEKWKQNEDNAGELMVISAAKDEEFKNLYRRIDYYVETLEPKYEHLNLRLKTLKENLLKLTR